LIGRRRFLSASAAILPLAYLFGCATTPALPPGLFRLGVASGEPTAGGIVLWTRLAPDPLNGGGMPAAPVEVAWSLAHDESFSRIVRRGIAVAVPDDAHSVHVQVDGLEAGEYWYRFVANGEASPTGRTRTAAAGNRLRFAVGSCQQYEHGFFAAHRDIAADASIDAVLFLGDYIYEASWGRNHVRSHGAPEAVTLAGYRDRYALYKSDQDLQAAHAAHPWLVTWDDHEVANDYADDRGERHVGAAFLQRRADAYKAFWEHLPLSPAQRPDGPALKLYRAFDFGGLARIALLDDRQYRDHQVCPRGNLVGGGNVVSDSQCPQRLDPQRSILGREQERWLEATLERSPARWNLLAQQTLMAQFDREPGPERKSWTDGWDGYPAARKRLLDFIAARRPANPLVLGGDVHATYIADLKPDFDAPPSLVVATELCGTSITSQGPAPTDTARRVAENPHVKFADSATRGYLRIDLQPERATAELRGVADVRQPESAVSTTARFLVEANRPGALVA
jgi:alkaline phosphatase D